METNHTPHKVEGENGNNGCSPRPPIICWRRTPSKSISSGAQLALGSVPCRCSPSFGS